MFHSRLLPSGLNYLRDLFLAFSLFNLKQHNVI